jgi:hypothetical protein
MVTRGRGRPHKYEWGKWFKQGEFVLWEGKDYTITTASMAQQIRSRASSRGFRVSLKQFENRIVAVVRKP